MHPVCMVINSKKNNYVLLLVDDDQLISQSIKTIMPPEWKVVTVQNPDDVNYTFPFHAAFIDMHLTGNINIAPGLKIVEKLRKSHPLLEIYAISGNLSIELMEQGLAAGAQKFFAKPLVAEEILNQLSKVEALVQIRNVAHQSQSYNSAKWIGHSNASENIRKQIANLRGEHGPILIEGESGCGKEVTAKLLHNQESLRPLISINIASIPENLFESELFGHMKGAFTGADQNKIGIIEAAQDGDLFIDEIEALPLNLQAKLLRFLESGEIKKVGAKESQLINCRVICASNRNLLEMVKNKEFREDLYWRIAGKKITLPPLRDRLEDIPILADYFLQSEKLKRNKSFAHESIELMKKYSWPGNVRELKRVCEQILISSPLPIIRPVDIKPMIISNSAENDSVTGQIDFTLGFGEIINRHEASVIKMALLKCGSDVEKTADFLQISKSNLYKKIKDYNIT